MSLPINSNEPRINYNAFKQPRTGIVILCLIRKSVVKRIIFVLLSDFE